MKRMNKIISVALVIIFLTSIIPLSEFSELDWSIFFLHAKATVDTVPDGFSGIYTATDLNDIRNNMSGKYILMNDIDLSGYKNWTPIGTSSAPFKGTFNGNGYTISKLTISDTSDKTYYGLFGYSEYATLLNIQLKDIFITIESKSNVYAGGVCGRIRFSTCNTCNNWSVSGEINVKTTSSANIGGVFGAFIGNTTEISNWDIKMGITVNAKGVDAGAAVGHLSTSGYKNGLKIKDFKTKGYINIDSSATARVSGIIGYASTDGDQRFTNCLSLNQINVKGNGRIDVGGILGSTSGMVGTYCNNCGNSGKTLVETTATGDSYIGGILGYTYHYLDNTFITECYNSSDIQINCKDKATIYVGGLLGYAYSQGYYNINIAQSFNCGSITSKNCEKLYIGGLAGYTTSNYYRSAKNSYTVGQIKYEGCSSVSEDNYSNMSCTNCYYLQGGNIAKQSKGTALTFEEFKNQTLLQGFNFNSVWEYQTPNEYECPILKNTPFYANIILKAQNGQDGITLDSTNLQIIPTATVNYNGVSLSIDAEGYYPVNINNCTLKGNGIRTFALIPESTNSHISAVHCNGVDALVDAQYVEFPIGGDNDEDKNRDVNIQVYTDLTDHKGFQLLYDGTILAESDDGVFNLKAKDITAGHTLKVRVIDAGGKKLSKIDTNIKTYKTTTTGKFFDNKISITFPQDLKIIGGWKFDVDLSSLPFFVLKDDDTIKIGVGASESSKWSKLNGKQDTTSYWDKDGTKRALWFDWKQAVKKTKQDILTNISTTILSEKTTDFSTFGCSLAGSELSPLKTDAKAALYAELKHENGQWTQVGADGFISVATSMSWSTFALVFYVPIEFKVTGKIDGSANISILYDFDNSKWDYSGTLDFTLPSLTGSATIGIPKVFNGGGYVNLTNKLKVTMWNNITGTLSGDLGVQGQFVIFSGSKSLWKFMDWEYLNKDFGSSSKQSVKKRTIALPDIGNTDDVFDESAYFLDTRDYLADQSAWLGVSAIKSGLKKVTSDASANGLQLLQSSIYQEARPQVISTDDGAMLMVWTADIAERSAGNQTAIVYSVYDELTGSWSAPTTVSDDGTADAYPDIATDGKDIYITWVNTNTTFDENVTMEEFAAACEICTAQFNKETGEFENIQTITENDNFDIMPAIYVENGEVHVAYTENSDNSPLTLSGTNTVTVIHLQDNIFETVSQTVIEKPVESVDISTINGDLTTVLSVDSDGDMQTTEDVEIYLIDRTGGLAQYTDNELYERGVQFESINGENALAYYDDSGIHYTDDFANERIIDSESGLNVSSDFYFVDDKDGTILLTRTNLPDSDIANVYASVWDGESWVGDAQVAICSDELKSFSACKNTNGNIQLVYTTAQYEAEITEDNGDGSATGTYTETVDMYVSSYARTTNVELVAVDFEDNNVIPGENLPVTLYVKNNGLKTIDTITVLGRCLGEEDSKDIPIHLKPGQRAEIEYTFPVPNSLSVLTDVDFSVTYEGDNNQGNNAQTAKIGYTNISLSLEKLSSGGLTSAVMSITNNSCIATDAKVLLHKDNYDGEVVVEYTVLDIPAFGEKAFYLNSNAINSNFDYGEAVCVEIVATKDEKSTGNNRDFFTVDTPETEDYSYTVLNDNKIRIDKYNGEDLSLAIPETYDGYTVSSLGAKVVPPFVTSITLPSGLETVTSTAFNSATGLTEININENNQTFTSKDGILYSSDGTKVIRCPIAIGDKTLVLSDEVIEINDYAFANVGLTSVSLPESLQIIRSYAFSNNNMTTVTIPEAVTRIERNSFEQCSNLTEINYNAISAETGISSTGTFAQPLIRSYSVFASDAAVKTINIGESVQMLSPGLFANLTGLETVNIASESKLVSIAAYTFLSDSSLSDVYYGRYYKYWKQITIKDGNDPITNAMLHCVECDECTWDEGIITTAANCVSAGVRMFICIVCEKERAEIVAINPNNHIGETSIINQKDPTCTQDGYTGDTICADCKVVLESGTSIPKTEHTWDAGTITQPAACTETGMKAFTCSVCSATRSETIHSLGHDVSTEWTIDKEPTCTESGTKSHHCSRCVFKTDITDIDALGHTWDQGEVATPATCTAKGIRTYTCSLCQNTTTEEISVLGHDYGDWMRLNENQHQRVCKNDSSHIEMENHSWSEGVVSKEVSCTENGIQTYTCIVCDATKTATIDAWGHNYGAWTKLNDNQHQRACTNNPTHVEKANHTWDAGAITKEAKCEESGVRTYTCTVCNATKTETINALGHTNPDDNGNCSRCGAHLKDVDPGNKPTDNSKPAGACKYCGQVHTGPFGWLIKFFHSILALFGLRK